MKRAWILVAALAGCGGSGPGPAGLTVVDSLPFEIDFCHVARLAVDPETGRVYMLDEPEEGLDILSAADCDPLQWQVLSPRSGRALSRTTSMTWDTRARRLILFERFSGDVLGLDRNGGSPRLLANVAGGGMDSFDVGRIAFDPTANRVLFMDRGRGAVVALALGSGAWRVVSDAYSGSGPAFDWVEGMAVDARRNRLFACDIAADRVVVVDLATGDRTVLDLPGLSGVQFVDVDAAGDRAFFGGHRVLMELDFGTGSAESIGTGAGLADMDYDPCGDRLLFNNVISITAYDLATRTSQLFAR